MECSAYAAGVEAPAPGLRSDSGEKAEQKGQKKKVGHKYSLHLFHHFPSEIYKVSKPHSKEPKIRNLEKKYFSSSFGFLPIVYNFDYIKTI